jgi:Tfp pilus assembly protein PilW
MSVSMASQARINGRDVPPVLKGREYGFPLRKGAKRSATGGFTLVEAMMVTAISAFVFAGVLSAYIFLGRGLVRVANAEQMESGTRTALYYFTKDVSSAASIAAQSSEPQITLTIPTQPLGTVTVTYSYDSLNLILSRTASNGTGPGNLLSPGQSGLSGLKLNFAFYDINGNPIAVPVSQTLPQMNIKQAIMSYTATSGSAVSGALSSYTVSSPLVVMKNKLSIQ